MKSRQNGKITEPAQRVALSTLGKTSTARTPRRWRIYEMLEFSQGEQPEVGNDPVGPTLSLSQKPSRKVCVSLKCFATIVTVEAETSAAWPPCEPVKGSSGPSGRDAVAQGSSRAGRSSNASEAICLPPTVTGGRAIAGVKCLPQVLVSCRRQVEQPVLSVHYGRSPGESPGSLDGRSTMLRKTGAQMAAVLASAALLSGHQSRSFAPLASLARRASVPIGTPLGEETKRQAFAD
jgi:hypothetical protein